MRDGLIALVAFVIIAIATGSNGEANFEIFVAMCFSYLILKKEG